MGIIVAIGGDQNKRNGHEYETEVIDRKIVQLTNKDKPDFLFLSIAGLDNESEAYAILKNMYTELGCICDCIVSNELNDYNVIEEKINNADIIYVGGGNTLTLMNNIKNYKIENLLIEAYKRNCVMCGSSAGAIAYFVKGHSDCYKKETGKYALVDGLKYINANFCPHYTIENRKNSLKYLIKDSELVTIALDNNAALILNDEQYELIVSDNSSNGYRCYYKNAEYYKEIIVKNYIGKTKDLLSKKMLNY